MTLTLSVSCLGKSHADSALSGTDCSRCKSFSLSSLRSWIAFFSESDSAPHALPFSSSQGPVRKKQQGRGSEQLVTSELTPAQCPHASPSPQRAFACPLHPTLSASLCGCEQHDLILCEWQRIGWQPFSGNFRRGKGYRALWLTLPSCRHLLHATPDSERMKSSSASWRRLSTSSGLNGLRLRSHFAAGLTSGFFRGAIRPSANARLPSSPKSTTSWRNRGAPPTRLASVLLLPLLSHLLTALKKKDTSTCLLWMSLWPHISARPRLSDGRRGRAIRPSRAEPHLHSLDAPTRRLDKRLKRYTLWLCSRSSRPRCSQVRKPIWMQLHSGTWGVRQTWLYAPPKPPLRPSGIWCPAW